MWNQSFRGKISLICSVLNMFWPQGRTKVPLRIAYVIWEFLTSSTYFFKARTATFFSLSIEKIRNEKYFCPSWGFRNNVKNFYRWWICTASLLQSCALWQYGLWSFQTGGTKLERFLSKNQHTQRKLLNFEKWISGGLRSFQKSEF